MDDNGPLQARQPRKIARQEWAAIKSRHATGESLASIARAYQCTAPAIRYIVRQNVKLDPSASPPKDEERLPPPARRPAGDNAGQWPVAAVPGPQAAGFNPELRETIAAQIAHFLVAFDAVLASPKAANCDQLRDAVDRLMRAAARIRIEMESFSV